MMNIEDISKDISLYPNPVEDILYVNLDGTNLEKGTKLDILDLSGRIVYSQNIDSNSINQKLNVNQLKSGAYMLVYYQNGERKTHKFIKK